MQPNSNVFASLRDKVRLNGEHFISFLSRITAETFSWLAVLLLHAATIPSLISILSGVTNRLPTVDMVLLVWGSLLCLFGQAIIQRNILQIVTITIGFAIQSTLLALIFFR